jgi:DNA-binding PadR family transcriptional regulator
LLGVFQFGILPVVAARQPLTPTGYAVLGLLSFGRELTGYELKQWAHDSLRFFYTAPAMSQIYSELERLRAAGLVRDRAVPDGHRTIRTYRLTPDGETVLRAWAEETEPEPPVLKHHVALRLFFGHLVGPDRLLEQTANHRAWVVEQLRELEQVDAGLAASPPEVWHYARLVADWGRRYYGAELEALDELRQQLETVSSSAPPPAR